jgi:ubiquinone/menaquinone biosynthesis C-methylase UbiE
MNTECRVTAFCGYLRDKKPLFWPAVKRNRDRNARLFSELGETLLEWAQKCLGSDYLRILADGYSSFVTDVNKSQMRYEERKRYQHSTFAEACKHVYHNEDYGPPYHWGVFVTTFAWEHHLHIYDFYLRYFLRRLPPGRQTVLDLGCGSGVWGLMLANALPEWNVTGVDISGNFVSFARRMAEVNGFSGRAAFHVGNALDFQVKEPVDGCISGFLLEHLEQPAELLNNISRNLTPGKKAFVTGALTAAEIDHITEFRRESELVLMAEAAGFRVESIFSSAPPDYPRSFHFLPRSMAMVLQKKKNEHW